MFGFGFCLGAFFDGLAVMTALISCILFFFYPQISPREVALTSYDPMRHMMIQHTADEIPLVVYNMLHPRISFHTYWTITFLTQLHLVVPSTNTNTQVPVSLPLLPNQDWCLLTNLHPIEDTNHRQNSQTTTFEQ
ncbi:hypothetical protein BO79DRAFT_31490 [Aspergillus costaricaensis CBS 115574]|uniref:Uncharacterized protein n=1 Tax=Aspergillus costaricaensis CBS 115574 TaxID=1448317 RepID=A0ACD1I931_9EURO|nr:hypothetical protein BO79DRAFT_31490 [Aspergillus costaricaensis CBS 115574]RAK87074.1 hypothetical protein BO79DRAFT_31490 [Aspergillus costaricaensis CBS 115574]